jgi:hypothetical protein
MVVWLIIKIIYVLLFTAPYLFLLGKVSKIGFYFL